MREIIWSNSYAGSNTVWARVNGQIVGYLARDEAWEPKGSDAIWRAVSLSVPNIDFHIPLCEGTFSECHTALVGAIRAR